MLLGLRGFSPQKEYLWNDKRLDYKERQRRSSSDGWCPLHSPLTVRVGATQECTVDGQEYHVEIKESHALPGRSGPINQIRPIKYITLVVYAPRRECWYVVPPNDLVYLAAQKSRGQHTEIPFECMNLTIRQLDDQGFKCIDADLPARVFEAVRKGKRDAETRKTMTNLFSAIKALRQEYKQKILRMQSY